MVLKHRQPGSPSAPTASLSFSEPGGPLVAVAGLCGGAGASTLAHLLAAAAAAESSAPVLLVETGGPSATLGLLAGAASRWSLVDLARGLEAGRRSAEAPFAVVVDGLRVIAAGPQFEHDVDEDALEIVLEDAQAAHGLTVVDCGSLTSAGAFVTLRRATHIVWIVPATELARARASDVLDALDLPLVGRELLAVRDDGAGAGVPATSWTAIARHRNCDIVLIPRVAAADDLPLAGRIAQAALALNALAGALR